MDKKPKCGCCGNQIINLGVGKINNYWLQGKKYIYFCCPSCWNKPFLKAVSLNQKQDIPENLIKRFGLSLGYTKEEIRAVA